MRSIDAALSLANGGSTNELHSNKEWISPHEGETILALLVIRLDCGELPSSSEATLIFSTSV